jgi:hypothetical protein
VVGRALRVFLVTLPDVNSDVPITCQFRYRAICQVSSRKQTARFGWINKQEKSDLAQTDVAFIDYVPRYGRVSENEKVELWQDSPYNSEDPMDI